jgi:acyl-homoserine-lactone acylase
MPHPPFAYSTRRIIIGSQEFLLVRRRRRRAAQPTGGELRSFRAAALLALLTMSGCASLPSWLPGVEPADTRLARTVTIVRDEWGVPTIYGPTDAAVVFGLAYAQAEDNYWQIEEDYIHAIGRASYWYGDRYLAADLVKAAFEVERLSRAEYAREPAERRVIWNAFAAGLNYYLRTAPGAHPRVIGRWEPWMLFARFRTVGAGTTVDGVRLGQVATLASGAPLDAAGSDTAVPRDTSFMPTLTGSWIGDSGRHGDSEPESSFGSNTWAVSGARTASGHAMLLQNPHVGFFGIGQRYEMQLHSGSGWHVRGFAILGTPMPRSGHNEHLGWSHTTSAADHSDVYDVVFDHPDDALLYRYDNEWRRAVEWLDTLQVNTPEGVVNRVVRFRRTHHGPIVAMRDGRALAVRVGRMEEGGSLQQWYAMGRATNLEQFRAALDQRALPISNTMYADRAGNIYYLHGNAVPRRAPEFDWSRPVDGNTAATEWQGYHPVDDLPQLLNPPGGWLQNTNSSPFSAADDGDNLDPAAFPGYMAPDPHNPRARSARRLLAGEDSWTFEEFERAAFDTYVSTAEDAFGPLVREWEEIGGANPRRAMPLDDAVDLLRAWDRVSRTDSEAMTLFVLWQERLRTGEYTGAYPLLRALEDVVARLERDFGSARVAWGEINRLQRIHTSGEGEFSEDPPSLPVAGAPGWTGTLFAFSTRAGPQGRRYGISGHSWVSVVELAPEIRSRSIVPFGQSADPSSPHYFDQAPLYSRQEMKTAWFTRSDVTAAARRSYHPGFTAPP